ncbi:MAG: hypothetical protein K2P51_08405 [Rhabdochlamydiaceae bacterium]|nr:hypothetical protein [Rhabdochlamydiaceae bacterium]
MASESAQRASASPKSLVSSSVHLDIIDALNRGDFVFLNNGKIERLFHCHMTQLPTGGCSSRTKYTQDPLENLSKQTRVISVDLTVHPYLLNLFEWPNKICQAGYGECKCSLKERVAQLVPITTWTYIDGQMYK